MGVAARAAVTEQWVRHKSIAPPSLYATGNAVVFDRDGNPIVAGFDYRIGTGSNHVIKYSSETGSVLWERAYQSFRGYSFSSAEAEWWLRIFVATDRSDDVIVLGSHATVERPNPYDFAVTKIAGGTGQMIWQRIYAGAGNSNDIPSGLVVDANGDVLLTGESGNTNGHTDFYTAKYDGRDGSVIWERFFDGPGHTYDQPRGIAVDRFGNVAITGSSFGESYDYHTIKYASDGATLWEQRYVGPIDADHGIAIAMDRDGNVVVTGDSANLNLTRDIYTAKYAAVDGRLLWDKRYDGPAAFQDRGMCIAVDPTGDVFVAGSSWRDSYSSDIYTAKYSGIDGALRWEVRYAHLTSGYNFPSSLVLDAGGNPILCGRSATGPNSHDFYTVKYASLNGRLVWDARYSYGDGLRNSPNWPQSLAAGPQGRVAITGWSAPDRLRSVLGWTTVLYQETLAPIRIRIVGGNAVLSGEGIPGAIHQLENAANPNGPWEVFASPVANTSGMVEFDDPIRFDRPTFYRMRTP